ncbi:MAG: thiamine phosphate synthase [Pseudomonadota bacterium]|nr:thiamine phosphate synthase [Pseudomonadota bacterium]
MASPAHRRLRGLYAITDGQSTALEARVAGYLAGGTTLVQYRDKNPGEMRRRREVEQLLELCRPWQVRVIVNDDVALAAVTRAGGVHLGRDDADLVWARHQLGDDALIGVSCYDSLERAESAVLAGADYVAFGRFFPSMTKPQAVPAPLELLRRARERLNVPIVAIGGITPENTATLIAAGADMVAVIGGLAAGDPVATAQRYTAQFTTTGESD